MSAWNEALVLLGKDMRRHWFNWVLTLVLFTFIALNAGSLMEILEGEVRTFPFFLLDFYFMMITPVIGCPWYSGKFTQSTIQQLRFLRSLPVSVDGLVLSRMLLVFLRAVLNGSIFYLVIYLMSDVMQAELGGRYIWYVLIGTGYTLFFSSWYPYWETLAHRPLSIWLSSVIFLAGFAVLAMLFWWVLDVQVIETVIRIAREHGPLASVISLALGLLGSWFWAWLTKKRLMSDQIY